MTFFHLGRVVILSDDQYRPILYGRQLIGYFFIIFRNIRHPPTMKTILTSAILLMSLMLSRADMQTPVPLWPDGAPGARARAVVPYAAVVFALLFTLAGVWVLQLHGYRITSDVVANGPSNPTMKTVARVAGGWWANYGAHPVFWLAPLAAYLGALFAVLTRKIRVLAWVCSALVPTGVIATAGLSLFPFLLPSSSNPDMSLTVWDWKSCWVAS